MHVGASVFTGAGPLGEKNQKKNTHTHTHTHTHTTARNSVAWKTRDKGHLGVCRGRVGGVSGACRERVGGVSGEFRNITDLPRHAPDTPPTRPRHAPDTPPPETPPTRPSLDVPPIFLARQKKFTDRISDSVEDFWVSGMGLYVKKMLQCTLRIQGLGYRVSLVRKLAAHALTPFWPASLPKRPKRSVTTSARATTLGPCSRLSNLSCF